MLGNLGQTTAAATTATTASAAPASATDTVVTAPTDGAAGTECRALLTAGGAFGHRATHLAP